MRTKTLAIAFIGLLAVCAGCGGASSAPAQRPGTIEGSATPCTGPITLYAYNRLPVTVELHQGDRLVARHSGHGTVAFRFSQSPGRYLVSSDQDARPATVTLQSGHTVKIDLSSACK